MNAFWISVASSILAGILLLVITNQADLHYFVALQNRYRHLSGAWYQYHLTTDSSLSVNSIWLKHWETLKISSFGRVRGTSHSPKHTHKITGVIRSGTMRLKYENQTVPEEPMLVCYRDLLSGDALVGVWQGKDFDQAWSAGRIILSRRELRDDQIDRIAKRLKVLD